MLFDALRQAINHTLTSAHTHMQCVMISAEIAEKLEGGMEWEVTLTPVKPETITKKVSKEAAPQSQQASPPEQESSPPPVSATPGMFACSLADPNDARTHAHALAQVCVPMPMQSEIATGNRTP